VDTSDDYSTWVVGNCGGESETIVGQWLRDRRLHGKVQVATKVGFPTSLGRGLSADHVRASAEASLTRLGLDSIDLYQLHCEDPATPPVETMAALLRLHTEGKLRHVGVCNMPAGPLAQYLCAARSIGLSALATYQGKLNYMERDRTGPELFRLVRDNGLVFIAYGVLARGFLSGKYSRCSDQVVSARADSVRRKYQRQPFMGELNQFLREATQSGQTPVQAAYGWVARELDRHGLVWSLIGGFTSPAQLREAVEAIEGLS
jgi:aryl-alcohol dehydrogenase-like predicted oxidoreductase